MNTPLTLTVIKLSFPNCGQYVLLCRGLALMAFIKSVGKLMAPTSPRRRGWIGEMKGCGLLHLLLVSPEDTGRLDKAGVWHVDH